MLQVTTNYNYLSEARGSKEKYCFKSSVNQVLTQEQLIREIVNYNSTLTDADVKAVFSVLNTKVIDYVNKGYKVELPFLDIRLKATGTCDSKEGTFANGIGNNKLDVKVCINPEALEAMTADVAYEQKFPESPMDPKIALVYSVNPNGTKNENLEFKPSDSIRITGKNLAFQFDDQKQGVFITDGSTVSRIEKYNRLGSNILDAFIPSNLEPGEYSLYVTTKPGKERYKQADFEQKILVQSAA